MGSSVTVTLQLQNADGNDVTGGAEAADEPAKWLVTISTYRGDLRSVRLALHFRSPLCRLTSDSDGKATFVLASLPDPRYRRKGRRLDGRVHRVG